MAERHRLVSRTDCGRRTPCGGRTHRGRFGRSRRRCRGARWRRCCGSRRRRQGRRRCRRRAGRTRRGLRLRSQAEERRQHEGADADSQGQGPVHPTKLTRATRRGARRRSLSCSSATVSCPMLRPSRRTWPERGAPSRRLGSVSTRALRRLGWTPRARRPPARPLLMPVAALRTTVSLPNSGTSWDRPTCQRPLGLHVLGSVRCHLYLHLSRARHDVRRTGSGD